MRSITAVLRTLAVLLALFASSTALADFCWKATYGRGVGTIPTVCASGQTNDAALCYTNCRAGYTGAGPACWGQCPSGFPDQGAICGKPSAYGRGAGYAWKFGDGLNDHGMYKRCENANGSGNCEKDGAIVYPKCRSGFHKVGCCVCSPDCPPGFSDGGATCNKPNYGRGAGTVPKGCTDGRVSNAGLCYKACNTAYTTATGPVCWKACSGAAPFSCGGGCARDLNECRVNLVNQAMAAVNFVLNFQSVPGGGIWYEAMKNVADPMREAILKDMLENSKNIALSDPSPTNVTNTINQAWPNATPQQREILSQILEGGTIDWKSIEPTHLASLAMAYTAPICR
jgi:hypothetical protein